MKKIVEKPYLIFITFSLILLFIGIFTKEEESVINIHDTYFVFAYSFIPYSLSVVFLIIGLGYWIVIKLNGSLSKKLNYIHTIITFSGLTILRIIPEFYTKTSPGSLIYDYNEKLNITMLIIFIITLLGQIIYPINLIRGIINRKKV